MSRRMSEFLGVTFFAVSLVLLIALVTYDPTDPVWFFNTITHTQPANFIGQVGAFISELSYQIVGQASYLIPVVFVVLGWHLFWCRTIDAIYTKCVGVVLLLACVSSFLSLAFDTLDIAGRTFPAGGYTGSWLAFHLSEYLNRAGSIIFILTALFLSIILSTQFSIGRMFATITRTLVSSSTHGIRTLSNWRNRKRRERKRQDVVRKHLGRVGGSTTRTELLAKSQPAVTRVIDGSAKNLDKPTEPKPYLEQISLAQKTDRGRLEKNTLAKAPSTPIQTTQIKHTREGYSLPPTTLLDPPKNEQKIDERELMDAARLLEEKCREFAVEGTVSQIHPGPVVTTYEFKPDAGVKYTKITGLANDLCLAMQAESVLIERIPGKSTVGIQIPNRIRQLISLRELLESEAYQQSNSKLTVVLGKTIHGEPFLGDLVTLPHLLIAGSTGTGKSVSLNAMLTSILYRATPDDVRLILIDPKRLELGVYEDIPHLLTPVVVDPKLASNALRWAVKEMEERYKKLASYGVRNIEQFNRNVLMASESDNRRSTAGPSEDLKKLPYIVLAIDELADLMMLASNEVEESIARIAQMARAVGIHLILATQRPSVDVITGLIKANLPARISFRVSSKIDSRTILDGNGAEQLLGNGDLLYLPPASSRLIRLHGAYISEKENARLTSFLRKQGSPGFNELVTAQDTTSASIDFEKDDLYEDAARMVVSTGQASISYLQRRFRIGFSRAARLVDMMEADGLVTAGLGGKAREVLVKQDYFEELDAQLR